MTTETKIDERALVEVWLGYDSRARKLALIARAQAARSEIRRLESELASARADLANATDDLRRLAGAR